MTQKVDHKKESLQNQTPSPSNNRLLRAYHTAQELIPSQIEYC